MTRGPKLSWQNFLFKLKNSVNLYQPLTEEFVKFFQRCQNFYSPSSTHSTMYVHPMSPIETKGGQRIQTSCGCHIWNLHRYLDYYAPNRDKGEKDLPPPLLTIVSPPVTDLAHLTQWHFQNFVLNCSLTIQWAPDSFSKSSFIQEGNFVL